MYKTISWHTPCNYTYMQLIPHLLITVLFLLILHLCKCVMAPGQKVNIALEHINMLTQQNLDVDD